MTPSPTVRRVRSPLRQFIVAAVVAAAGAGCQTTTTKSLPMTRPDPPVKPITAADAAMAPGTEGGTMTADQAIGIDPSAARLQDILERLLPRLYANQPLPPSLADAVGPGVPVVDPAGRPYLYAPHGFSALGAEKRILVADPVPSVTGYRWCIRMPPKVGVAGPVTAEVVPIPEVYFRAYERNP